MTPVSLYIQNKVMNVVPAFHVIKITSNIFKSQSHKFEVATIFTAKRIPKIKKCSEKYVRLNSIQN